MPITYLEPGLRNPEVVINQNFDFLGTAIYARVNHGASQSIADATHVALAFNAEREDTDTIHDGVTNNSRLTCKTAGVYVISGNAAFAANATGARGLGIRFGGSIFLALNFLHNTGSAGAETILNVSTIYRLAVNQYVELTAYQSSGGALNVLASDNYTPEFTMARIGA